MQARVNRIGARKRVTREWPDARIENWSPPDVVPVFHVVVDIVASLGSASTRGKAWKAAKRRIKV